MKDVKKVIKKYQISKIIIFIVIIAVALYIAYDRFFVEEDYQQAISHTNTKEVEKEQVILPMLPPKTMSPIASTSADVQQIGRLVYSRLFKFDQHMTPEKDLVDSYDLNGNQINIKLKDAKWHRGGKVTADDIIFTVEAIKKCGKKGPYFEKIEKIDTITGQDKKLTITFKNPTDISLAYLSFPIVCHSDYNPDWEKDNKVIPQGSGMYELRKYNRGKDIRYMPNKEYYGPSPKSALVVEFHKKSSKFATLVETSNISAYYTKNVDIESEITKENMEILSFPSNSIDFIGFNVKNSILKNGYLRAALVYAIDMDDVHEDFYYDSLIKTDSLYIPNFYECEKGRTYKLDLEKSVKYLKAAKILDYDGDGVREYGKDNNINLKILVDSGNKERVYTAEGLVDFFDDIGIDSTVVKVPKNQYMDKLEKGEFDLYVGGMNLDETMDFRPLLGTDGKLNYTGFSDADLDEKMNQFMSGNSNDENQATINEIKEIIFKKIPYYPIGYHKCKIIKSPALKGDLTPNFVNPYEGINQWYCVYEKILQDDKKEEKSDSDK